MKGGVLLDLISQTSDTKMILFVYLVVHHSQNNNIPVQDCITEQEYLSFHSQLEVEFSTGKFESKSHLAMANNIQIAQAATFHTFSFAEKFRH